VYREDSNLKTKYFILGLGEALYLQRRIGCLPLWTRTNCSCRSCPIPADQPWPSGQNSRMPDGFSLRCARLLWENTNVTNQNQTMVVDKGTRASIPKQRLKAGRKSRRQRF